VTGEHLSADVQELLRLLHEHGVRYVIVGGEAVIHHGYPRLTGDIDLFYDRSAANAGRLFAALREFWQGDVPSVGEPAELTEEDIIVQFGRPPNRVDLLSTLAGVPFARAWRQRVTERLVAPARGELPVYFIGLADLLTNKRAAGRHKDLDDVEHLSRSRGAQPRRTTTGSKKDPGPSRRRR
jgi:hypothetical protein